MGCDWRAAHRLSAACPRLSWPANGASERDDRRDERSGRTPVPAWSPPRTGPAGTERAGSPPAAEALGLVDMLVSNAGLSRVQRVKDITASQFDEILSRTWP